MIGAGGIAKHHCKDIAAYRGAELVSVADISKERREALADEFGIANTTAKWQDLVKDKEVDAITIALPNYLHAPVSIAALKAGKHVHLDKPFAMNLGEAKRVAAAAKKSRKVFMVGMNQRYGADAQALRNAVAKGMLGDIYHARALWCRRSGSPRFGTWFVSKKLSGGGCMLDIGVHALDLVLYIMDNWSPVSVSGRVTTTFGPTAKGAGGWGKSDAKKSIKFNVDDEAHAFIKFRNGATLELGASWIRHQKSGAERDLIVYGTKACAEIRAAEGDKIYRPSRKKQGEYEGIDIPAAPKSKARNSRITDWLDGVAGKRKPLCTVKQALTVQKILDGVYKSSKTGREVRLK